MNRTALVAAVAVALVGVLLFGLYMKRFEEEATGGAPVSILMVTQDVDMDTALTQPMLAVREVPRAYVESRHIKAADLSRILGVRVSTGLRANQSVMWSDLSTANESRRELSTLLREGMRAMTVSVEGRSAFGGLLRAGDRVDVLLSAIRPNSTTRVTLPLLQNILVLAVGADTGGPDAAEKAIRRGGSRGREVSLAVTIEQAALLTHAQDTGALQLILRNPDDVEIRENIPDTTDTDLIEAAERVKRSRGRTRPTPMVEMIENITGGRR